MSLYTSLASRFISAQLPRALRGKMLPMKITVASTFKCNHRCKICSIWRIYQENPGELKNELTPDDYGKIFHDLRSSLIFLDWGGGEPFLRDDISDILKLAAETCPHLSSYVITTNGLLFEKIEQQVENLLNLMPKKRFTVSVSLDGDEQTHDVIRGRDGFFKAAVNTVNRLKDLSSKYSNLEVTLSHTLSSMNAGKFHVFYENVVRELGMSIGSVGFSLEHVGGLFQTGHDDDRTAGVISAEEYRNKVKEDVAYIIKHMQQEHLPLSQRLKTFYRGFFVESIPGYLDNPHKMVFPCKAIRNSVYLDPHGNVYPCIVWEKKLGNVKDGIRNVLSDPESLKAASLVDNEKCPICWNACEVIPSLLTDRRLIGCIARSII